MEVKRKDDGGSPTRLLTVPEAAMQLGLKPATIRKMLFLRRLPSVKIGRAVRLKIEDVEAVIKAGYRPALLDGERP